MILRQFLPIRIFLIFFLLLCLPLFIDAFVLIKQSQKEAVENAQTFLLDNAGLRERLLVELLPTATPNTQLLANALNLHKYFPESGSEALNKQLENYAQHGNFELVELFHFNAKDQTFIGVGSSHGIKKIGRDHTEDIKSIQSNNKEFNVIWTEGAQKFYFLTFYFVYSEQQQLLGAVVGYTSIGKKLNEFLRPSLDRFSVFYGILLPSSVVIHATDPDLVMNYFAELDPKFKEQLLFRIKLIREQNFPMNSLAEKPLNVRRNREYPLGDYHFFEFEWKSKEYFAHVTEIGKTGYYLLTYVNKKEVIAETIAGFTHIYGAYALILLAGGGLALLATLRLARPLKTFIQTMGKVESGNENVRCQTDPIGFELNQLALTFNEMLDTLQANKKISQEERVKSELYKKELDLGEQVQRRLYLEKKIIPEHVDIASYYLPALEVGGDFCDLFQHKDKLVLMIADAAGKGVEACFYSLIVRSLLRILSQEISDTAVVIDKANALFLRDVGETGFFVTVLLAFYDIKTSKMTYYSGGHNPPIVKKRDGTIVLLKDHGPALGIDLGAKLSQSQEILLEEGDIIVFYTDGVTEAHNKEKKQFSERSLIDVIVKSNDESASTLGEAILQAIHAFENGAMQHDDITLMVMKIGDKRNA